MVSFRPRPTLPISFLHRYLFTNPRDATSQDTNLSRFSLRYEEKGFARFGDLKRKKKDPLWKRSAVPIANGQEAHIRNNLMWGGGVASCVLAHSGAKVLFLGSPTAALVQRDYCSAFRHFPPLLPTSTVCTLVLLSLVSSTLFSSFCFFNLPFILHFHKSFCCCCCSCSSSSALSHSSLF